VSNAGYGAEVVTYDRFVDNREKLAGAIIEKTGASLIPPFDHPMIIADKDGALELLEQAGELDALFTPVGGGGLLSGCAVAARAANPKIRIFGAEPERANDTYLSSEAESACR